MKKIQFSYSLMLYINVFFSKKQTQSYCYPLTWPNPIQLENATFVARQMSIQYAYYGSIWYSNLENVWAFCCSKFSKCLVVNRSIPPGTFSGGGGSLNLSATFFSIPYHLKTCFANSNRSRNLSNLFTGPKSKSYFF